MAYDIHTPRSRKGISSFIERWLAMEPSKFKELYQNDWSRDVKYTYTDLSTAEYAQFRIHRDVWKRPDPVVFAVAFSKDEAETICAALNACVPIPTIKTTVLTTTPENPHNALRVELRKHHTRNSWTHQLRVFYEVAVVTDKQFRSVEACHTQALAATQAAYWGSLLSCPVIEVDKTGDFRG